MDCQPTAAPAAVYGAIEPVAGLAGAFDPRRTDSPGFAACSRIRAQAGDAPNCNETGSPGVRPGFVGMIQVIAAPKLLPGIGELLIGRLLCTDALFMRLHEMPLTGDPTAQRVTQTLRIRSASVPAAEPAIASTGRGAPICG